MIRRNPNVVVLAVAVLSLACRGGGHADAAQGQPDAAGKEAGQERHEEHGPDAGSGERGARGRGRPRARRGGVLRSRPSPSTSSSRPPASTGRRRYECDECRYEVGVVRVPAKLVDGGLVKTASVSKRRVEAPIVLTGEVRFDERHVAHLSPRIEGTVRKVHASLGERVRRGQPIIELDSVQLGEAESDYLAAQAALRLARSSFERQEQLRKEQISSEKEYLSARQEHEAAQIRARSAHDKLARLGVTQGDVERLASASRSAGDGALVVRAPADGIVLEMHAVPGELVKPDESIVTVGDVSSVWVWADLHEDQLGKVLDAQRGEKLRARDRREGVSRTAPSRAPSTSSARRWTSGRGR